MSARIGADGWWRGGVIYQVYPRSFQDSNADGVGDLRGIVQRMAYLADLGVDAIWISPFFKSPMKDFGYDISDYRDVDPLFGTLADFDALVASAHHHGLKVLIDQVMSHCADVHPWFCESRTDRTNARANWFVWSDPRPDGTPPNNWLSVFGGSAWQWDVRRRQYYLHNFLSAQPDLNFHHPEVQDAVLENLRFWLDRGVDGFRLDAVNFCFHDPLLRDNPPRDRLVYDPAVHVATPYAWQRHLYDKSQPECLPFLRRLRALLDRYPGTAAVGEVADEDTLRRMAEYTGGGDKLHMAYGFELLGPRCDARYLHHVIGAFEATVHDGWACWALSNHDVPRVATRWRMPGVDRTGWLRLVAALQMSLRGSPCIYQGDELGLTEAELDYADLQDPVGLTMWPETRGRDGCRTPMPWDAGRPHLGFSDAARTWLPQAAAHGPLAALGQLADPASLRSFYRRLLLWRREQPALRSGRLTLLPADDAVLAFVRGDADGSWLCAFNLGSEPARYRLPAEWAHAVLDPTLGLAPASRVDDVLLLPPCGVAFARR
ncbi:MAG: alpha-amylase family glycosyl hydrolase [Pseudomonadota bacterium]|nr:alpha-amylase family glycosyl hydrolase [Pseudomonadota bacterium]